MSLPRYPKYKDSGVEWLGQVPEHWETCLLKRLFRSIDYGISDSLDAEGPIAILRMGNIANGKIVTDDLKYTDTVDPSLLLKAGDLLYNRTNSLDLIGKVGMFLGGSHIPVSFASYLVRLRTMDNSSPNYFAYLLNTEGILGLARAHAFVAVGQCNLNPTRYVQIAIALPPLPEQHLIATFLDHETAKIDALVSEQEKLITLLKEKRQAVISHAVTKGLDPTVPMKDSGVEWLGEVPEGWDVIPLKRRWSVTDCKHITAEFVDEGIPLASIREVQSRIVNLTDAKMTTRAYYELLIESERKPLPGDLIFSRNATVGEVAQVSESHPPFAMGQDVCLLRSLQNAASSCYMQHVLKSSVGSNQLELVMIGSTFRRVNVEEIRNLIVPFPPCEEQQRIADTIDQEISQLDTLITEAQRVIELLKERRSALISAAVTGQIDVRGLAKGEAA